MSNKLAELLNSDPDAVDDIPDICTECGADVGDKSANACPQCGAVLRLATLKEWGKKLPIGVVEGNGLNKEFDLRVLDWTVEREISRTWDERGGRGRGTRMTDYLGAILAHTVVSIGGVDFLKQPVQKRMLILNEMFLGDVFYMYAWLRIQSLGAQFEAKNLQCPSCRKSFDQFMDLETLEIVTKNEVSKLERTITLRDGFELMGETRTQVTLRPALFKGLGVNSPNQAEVFGHLLRASVTAIPGCEYQTTITENEVSRLSKWDMALLEDAIDSLTGGPRWDLECTCSKCGEDFVYLVDWTYQNFFKHSSRSRRRRKRSVR
jgi:predicted RNA-binding Zn-ribbon protein involved in translation (DUF1610 family)